MLLRHADLARASAPGTDASVTQPIAGRHGAFRRAAGGVER
ncbi:MAG TPA: hypothetical protein VE033_02795 [Acetobacteraceae bacterium]|nr:hypothetical protein [Acetobacteraceae bacterium]